MKRVEWQKILAALGPIVWKVVLMYHHIAYFKAVFSVYEIDWCWDSNNTVVCTLEVSYIKNLFLQLDIACDWYEGLYTNTRYELVTTVKI
jgi:hypothetical protein